ncbi:hypothetical protein FT663_01978 [Candidozyma haemuli var. vulneris]|uniref:Uncharacterized protein n=1 Tax=Candidozyma haemuli TaxID=45357 RepID=A0A2V1AUS8_9ASCO|nr:hypothetical protein CXQ85_000038 [[Candida] haemuloni]KAF3988631.1 hypothetical protein FT662_03310 [[Candida] haemuloni var. vulneris]KAF3993230.1 hypothetical protein FT663_01978 [[Candida] haemuloni var. vulneris]PVH21073.1 hypothetical protein CXQ85_000038 [[Candida] haemuloni]
MVSKKKPKKALDLSDELGCGERTADFTVKSYDYAELQSGISEADIQFETDLKYLLTSSEANKVKLNKSAKKKAANAIHDKEPKSRIKRRTLRTKLEEITQDMKEIVLSSDEEEEVVDTPSKPKSKRGKSKSKESTPNEATVKTADTVSLDPEDATESSKASPFGKGHEAVSTGDSEVTDEQKPQKKAKKKKSKKQKSIEPEDSGEAGEAGQQEKPKDHSETPPPVRQRQQTAPKKISPAQISSTILPEKEPVSTIIGLTPEHILKMRTNDVKFKTILTVPGMSKMCRNVLNFVIKESEGILEDASTRSMFVELCVSVAMREANGFHDTSRKYPELLQKLSQAKELTLEHTKTTYTESNRQAHKNDFDYSVFSYIGHLVIWASHLQWKAGKSGIVEEYGYTKNDVVASMGGWHLWDRIRRDPKTINMKRWKHIQKFRQNYAFEEHQFIVILRFMHLGTGLY